MGMTRWASAGWRQFGLEGLSAPVASEPVVFLDLLDREFASALHVCEQVDRLKLASHDAQVFGNVFYVRYGRLFADSCRSEDVRKAAFRHEYIFALGDCLCSHLLMDRLDASGLCGVEVEFGRELEQVLRSGETVQLGRSREAHSFTVPQPAHLIGRKGRNVVALGVRVGRRLVMVVLRRCRRQGGGNRADPQEQSKHGRRCRLREPLDNRDRGA